MVADMVKRVLVIASGRTEQMALPHLLTHLSAEGIAVEVRIPDRNRKLLPSIVASIIYDSLYDFTEETPDKYVVLIDTDGKTTEDVLRPLQEGLQRANVERHVPSLLYAYAQWHLEAWYFADAGNLRVYLGRDVGNVNPNQPDRIENPKHHLMQLLGTKTYTSTVSEEIAKTLDAQTIAQRSPSFAGFLAAVRNGDAGD